MPPSRRLLCPRPPNSSTFQTIPAVPVSPPIHQSFVCLRNAKTTLLVAVTIASPHLTSFGASRLLLSTDYLVPTLYRSGTDLAWAIQARKAGQKLRHAASPRHQRDVLSVVNPVESVTPLFKTLHPERPCDHPVIQVTHSDFDS